MTAQMNVPKLRFGCFSDTWEQKSITEVATKVTDGTHDTPKPVESGMPYITAIHVKDGSIDFDNCYYVTPEVHQAIYKRCNPEKGDLLLVNIGAGTATCAINTYDAEFSMKNVALIKPDREIIDPYFLEQIQRKSTARLFHRLTSGGAQPFFSLKEIKKLIHNYPNLPEQQKIASFLSKVDEKITLLTEKKAKLTEYKKGVMQQLFNGKWDEQDGQLIFIPPTLRFKADDGSEFPDWTKSTLGDIGKVKMCKRIMANQTSENGDIPFFKIGTFGREPDAFISQELYDEYRHKFSFPNVGDILMSASGTLGRTVVYDGSPAYFQDSNIVWIENDGSFTTNEFLFYVYQIVKYQSEGGTIQRLYNNIIMSAVFDNPSLKEQKKIVKFLSAIDQKIDLANSELEKAKEWKRGLLQQMFV